MRLTFSRPQRPHTIYIQESFRDKDGKSTSRKIETLGTEEDIERKYGCPDGLQWARDYVARLNEEKRQGKEKVRVDLSPSERIRAGEQVEYSCGDLLLLPIYNGLGLPEVCAGILCGTKARYDLNGILETLVILRILCPCSKLASHALGQKRIRRMTCDLEDVYRALTLLSSHIDDIQAAVWKNSQKLVSRDTRVIFYDCTNYYFEIEDNDPAGIDPRHPGRPEGIRRRGKSKEHRPNPIVQMGLLMDSDGIPLSFIIFAGNESEQPSLRKIEEMVAEKFGLNEFVISTDAGLSSEDNRRYNMSEGREYIAVQSLPKLPEADREMALDPRGWHIAFRDRELGPLDPSDPGRDTFRLDEIDMDAERHTRFYKEIVVNKRLDGKKDSERAERVIVTYSHDFALYLKHKREERRKAAERIVSKRQTSSRQSQNDPRKYVETVYVTAEGEAAEHILMGINQKVIEQEERLDGFYAYATSLDDDAVDVLRARSFHYEIEHLFRTTKSFLDSRPVYLQRSDRIRSHFLICFLAMVMLKILQKKVDMPDVSIDRLISTLRGFRLAYIKGAGYIPLFERDELTDRLQEVNGICVDTQIVRQKTLNSLYRNMLK
ncbi:MAG: hypothetical protein K2I92_03785 [Muribaculaceae bacterium]|nr:hypothetical protein [Muribaculaceae bacterium]